MHFVLRLRVQQPVDPVPFLVAKQGCLPLITIRDLKALFSWYSSSESLVDCLWCFRKAQKRDTVSLLRLDDAPDEREPARRVYDQILFGAFRVVLLRDV